jgi:hypothetical protein
MRFKKSEKVGKNKLKKYDFKKKWDNWAKLYQLIF